MYGWVLLFVVCCLLFLHPCFMIMTASLIHPSIQNKYLPVGSTTHTPFAFYTYEYGYGYGYGYGYPILLPYFALLSQQGLLTFVLSLSLSLSLSSVCSSVGILISESFRIIPLSNFSWRERAGQLHGESKSGEGERKHDREERTENREQRTRKEGDLRPPRDANRMLCWVRMEAWKHGRTCDQSNRSRSRSRSIIFI